MALLLLSIVSVAVINLNSQLFWRTDDLRKWYPGMQLVQGCMELVLAAPRPIHFSAATGASSICNGLNMTGYTLNVSYGAISPDCVGTLACRQIEIGVTGLGSKLSLQVVNY